MKSKKKEVQLFTSESCAPCRVAKGFLDAENIVFEEINVEKLTTKQTSKITSIPTVICKTDGKINYRFEGFSVAVGNKIKIWYKK